MRPSHIGGPGFPFPNLAGFPFPTHSAFLEVTWPRVGVGARQGLPGPEALGRAGQRKVLCTNTRLLPTSGRKQTQNRTGPFKFQIRHRGLQAGVFGCKNRNTRVCVEADLHHGVGVGAGVLK